MKRNCRCHTKRRVYLWLWIMTVAGKIAWWCKGENGIDWSPTHYWGMLWSATNRASANAILQLNSPLCFGIIVHSWLLKWLTTRHLTIVQNKTRVMPPAKCRGGCHFPDHAQCWKIIPKAAFNIVSEASYVFIMSGQKFTQSGPFWRVFEPHEFVVK